MYALGLEQAGHEVTGFCEREEFCQRILKKHWPEKPISSCIKLLTRALTASLAAGRAKILAPRDGAPDYQESVLDYGGISLEPFAWFDQKSQCWRTWQLCFIAGWEEFSGTWPPSGMIGNGIAYQLSPLAWHTNGAGAGLWPTPQARDGRGHYMTTYESTKMRQKNKRQLHWIHHAILKQGLEGRWTANPRFSEEMMGVPHGWTDLGPSATETRPKSSDK